VPAFSTTMQLPAALHIVSPGPGVQEIGLELPVEWLHDDTIELTLEMWDFDGGVYPNAYVNCRMDNDGSFVVPSTIIEQLPSDYYSMVISFPGNYGDVLLSDDRMVYLYPSVWAGHYGLLLP